MIMKTMRDLRGCIYSKIVCSPRKSTRAQSISESADIRVINTSKADISDFRGTFMVWPLIGGLEKAMFYANKYFLFNWVLAQLTVWEKSLGFMRSQCMMQCVHMVLCITLGFVTAGLSS